MIYVGQKINSWKIALNKRVDETVCNQDLPHGDYYLVVTGPDEHVIVILPFGEQSENIMRKAVEKELLRIRGYQGKIITI